MPILAGNSPMQAVATMGGAGRRAKNVIFVVSDGMSLGTLVIAERYRQLIEGRGSHWLSSYSRADIRRALMDTASLNSLVTDSSAASSSWGCGKRVKNGAVNSAPDGTLHTPIFHLAKAAGVATGLVTTATVTHATPAGFVAQGVSRTQEQDFAAQYERAGMQVILGGGRSLFDPAQRKDGRDLLGSFSSQGYTVVRDREALLQAPSNKPLLGLFEDGHLPYMLDHMQEPEQKKRIPTLAEMTKAALANLVQAPNGFLVQIEGAHVDSGAHANDIGATLFEQLALDDAIGVVMDFVKDRDDTLVILTSDHGNANPGLNGVGGSFTSKSGAYGATGACFERLSRFRRTNSWILKDLNGETTPEQVFLRVKQGTGLELDDEDAELLCKALRREHREAYRVNNAPIIALGQVLSNYVSIGWTGVAHTSDFTELAAFGPGCESIQGVVPNTHLFTVMKQALGI